MRKLSAKRIVVKLGTNTVCRTDGTIDQSYLEGVAKQVMELSAMGIQTIIVTSGAIGSGITELGLERRPQDMAAKQACAAVGQATLMMAWRDAFRKYGKCVGQVLLTYGAFSDRVRYLNLKNAMDEMLKLGIVPIVNENDVIATDEIEEIFGDNDKLSALVASKIDADLVLLLTDVDGLYDRNPEVDPDAQLIRTIDEITKDIERMAGKNVSDRSVGGMRTKISAAKVAMQSGINMVIANGRTKSIILRIINGEELGTLFTAQIKYSNKQRWILFAAPKGKVNIDPGAERAIRSGKSLLPCGVTSIEGRFKKGEVVRIGSIAKGLANFSSSDLPKMLDKCAEERTKGNGKVRNDKVVASNENIVLLDSA
jgi:glutamate 5-kinase